MRLALVLLLVAAPAVAEGYQPKKDRERLGKSTNHPPPPPVGAKPTRLVNLYNHWTLDWLAVDPAVPPTADEMNAFLRDHFTNKSAAMDGKLIPTVCAAAKQFHSDIVDVVSGFRHPKFNLMLRKKGHQVARDSQHTHGNAIDFTIPNVSTKRLHDWAVAQKLGGVGLYLESGFVHIDTGPVRFWSGD